MKNFLLLGLALSGLVGSLSATPIKIFNTGANGAGADSNYQVSAFNDCSLPSTAPAVTVNNPNWAWASPLAGSMWINPSGNAYQSYCANCYYAFTTTFNLTGLNPMSAVLSGKILADDHVAVGLNGSWITSWLGGYTQPTDFSIGSQYSSLFKTGVNTLTFAVANDGGPMGLDAVVSGTADASAVPEPGAAGLVAGSGLLLVTVGLYRRRGRATKQKEEREQHSA